jgi:hypothetical protein
MRAKICLPPRGQAPDGDTYDPSFGEINLPADQGGRQSTDGGPMRVVNLTRVIEDRVRGRANCENLLDVSGGKVFVGTNQDPWIVPLCRLRFTHDEVSDRFSDRRTIYELSNRLIRDPEFMQEVPPLRVVKIGEDLYSLDNRRLASSALAQLSNVRVRWATVEEIAHELGWRFSTKCFGLKVEVAHHSPVRIPA